VIWKASSCDYRSLRDLALIDLLFATGIRVGEASALDIRDFFVREAAFRVQGKGGRDRLAFIVDEETVRIQRAHLEARANIKTESSALFINTLSQRLSTQGITNVIARLRREARIKRHVTRTANMKSVRGPWATVPFLPHHSEKAPEHG
jgi:site-specific recombinase XerD